MDVDIETEEELESLRAEVERLRAALQDAKDLALADAPAHMVVDVCDRALHGVKEGLPC